MKIGRLNGGAAERLGLVIPIDGKDHVLDLEKAAIAKLGNMPIKNTMMALSRAVSARWISAMT